ncbi:uncharacterized protein LTR77_001315 [Saxophila tyrrhenica]|uniref:Uncharacterized protein n=1 Tax=Saxophila tyrrhenica TaxID=1690608 RepID=A0AAV9PJY3_9PEZI|nr:hypothetical protein LTR77_001315 [Saxophila tyrrhenica]
MPDRIDKRKESVKPKPVHGSTEGAAGESEKQKSVSQRTVGRQRREAIQKIISDDRAKQTAHRNAQGPGRIITSDDNDNDAASVPQDTIDSALQRNSISQHAFPNPYAFDVTGNRGKMPAVDAQGPGSPFVATAQHRESDPQRQRQAQQQTRELDAALGLHRLQSAFPFLQPGYVSDRGDRPDFMQNVDLQRQPSSNQTPHRVERPSSIPVIVNSDSASVTLATARALGSGYEHIINSAEPFGPTSSTAQLQVSDAPEMMLTQPATEDGRPPGQMAYVSQNQMLEYHPAQPSSAEDQISMDLVAIASAGTPAEEEILDFVNQLLVTEDEDSYQPVADVATSSEETGIEEILEYASQLPHTEGEDLSDFDFGFDTGSQQS